MIKLKQIIPIINSEIGMFNEPCVVKVDGSISRPINTEILPAIQATHLGKTKMSSLIPVLNWIAKDWSLDLSKTHDRMVAFRILKNSIIKN